MVCDRKEFKYNIFCLMKRIILMWKYVTKQIVKPEYVNVHYWKTDIC